MRIPMKTGLSIIDNKDYQLWLQHLCYEIGKQTNY